MSASWIRCQDDMKKLLQQERKTKYLKTKINPLR